MAQAQRKTIAPSSISGNYYVYPVVLNATDIVNKLIVLPVAPTDPADVTLSVKHGPIQYAPEDFIVIGDELSWDGRALELDLVIGDKLQVQFVI